MDKRRIMSLKTAIQNLRTDLAVRKASMDAAIQIKSDQLRKTPIFGVTFALGFVFMLMALAVPVSAGDLNDSVSPIIQDMVDLFGPLLDLIIAAVPLIIATALIGFILGILGAILSKMHV